MGLLKHIQHFMATPAADPATAALYRACINQARANVFYSRLGVPDTVDGRFDMLLLHVLLAMRRLAKEGEARQRLFDLMFADMDRSLREMGVGDMGIGKKIKPMMAAFYGRAKAYETALAGSDADLSASLRRNLYGKAEPDEAQMQALAAYVRNAVAALNEQKVADLLQGHIVFPTIDK